MSEGALDFDAPDDGLSNVDLDVENSAEFYSGQQEESKGTNYGGQSSEETESKSQNFQVPTHCGGPNAAVWNAILQQVRGGKENCPVVGYMQMPMIGGDPSAGPCTFGFSFGNAKEVSPEIQPFCMTNPCQQGQVVGNNNESESDEGDSSEGSSDEDDDDDDENDKGNDSISYGNYSGQYNGGYYGKGSGYGGYGSYPGSDYYYGGGGYNKSHPSKKGPKNDKKDPKEPKTGVVDTTAPPQTMQPFMGVVPQCTQAAECPKVDLPTQWPPKPCKVTANDEEGLNFNFKPRKDFATEVTFTIEPKKKPLWQKMMQCGFRPMITCAAPPFRLPGDFQTKKTQGEEDGGGTKDRKEDKSSKNKSARRSSKSRGRHGKGSDNSNSSSYVVEESVRQYDGSYSTAYSTSDQGTTTQSSSSESSSSRPRGRRREPETSSYNNYPSGYSYPGYYGSSHGSNGYQYSPSGSNYYSSYPSSYQTYSVGYSYEDSYYDYYNAYGGSGSGNSRRRYDNATNNHNKARR